MKKKFILLAAAAMLSTSCSVQQFSVNTNVEPFQNGGKAFGEKTKGTTFKKSAEFFVFGINVKQADTPGMAKSINAEAYTIETKNNLLSPIVKYFTFGIVEYKVVKVIKR